MLISGFGNINDQPQEKIHASAETIKSFASQLCTEPFCPNSTVDSSSADYGDRFYQLTLQEVSLQCNILNRRRN
jgi:hypothetical protein